MMHIITEQIAFENGHAGPILHVPLNFDIFRDRLAAGLRNNVLL